MILLVGLYVRKEMDLFSRGLIIDTLSMSIIIGRWIKERIHLTNGRASALSLPYLVLRTGGVQNLFCLFREEETDLVFRVIFFVADVGRRKSPDPPWPISIR